MNDDPAATETPLAARVSALVLALLLPALVFWGYGRLLGLDEVPEKSEAALAIDAELEAGRPDVLLLGSSQLGRGVDSALLDKLLGDEASVQVLWRSQMSGPHLYAVLKNRVFASEHPPRLVLVVATVGRLLSVEVENDQRETILQAQLTDFEPALATKVYGRENVDPRFGRLKQRRSALQEELFRGLKGLTVGTLFGGEGEGSLVERGAQQADRAADELFGAEGATDMDAHRRAVPITDLIHEGTVRKDVAKVGVQGSLLPDYLDLAEEHGARIVLVSMPVAGKNTREVPPEIMRELMGLLGEHGGGHIDLSELPVERRHFRDATHLSTEGSKIFTAALAERMLTMNLLDPDAEFDAEMPLELALRQSWSRIGAPPTLPEVPPVRVPDTVCGWRFLVKGWAHLGDTQLTALGLGKATPIRVLDRGEPLSPFGGRDQLGAQCAGASAMGGGAVRFSPSEGKDPGAGGFSLGLSSEVPMESPAGEIVWLYPGTSLQLELSGEVDAEHLGLSVVAVATTEADSLPTLGLGEVEVPFVAGELFLHAELDVKAPHAAWQVVLKNPSDGPFVALRALDVTLDGDTLSLMERSAAEATTVQARILPKWGTAAWRFAEDPPEIAWDGEFTQYKGGAGRVELPDLRAIASDSVRTRTLARRASPVVVYEDGKKLGSQWRCNKVREEGIDVWCHYKDVVIFASSDGSPTLENGHRYTIAYEPSRVVGGGSWLYGGDDLSIDVPGARVASLGGAASVLHLEGFGFGGPADEEGIADGGGDRYLRLRILSVDGELLHVEEIPLSSFREGGYDSTFEEGLELPKKGFVLRLDLPDQDRWFFLRDAVLSR